MDDPSSAVTFLMFVNTCLLQPLRSNKSREDTNPGDASHSLYIFYLNVIKV